MEDEIRQHEVKLEYEVNVCNVLALGVKTILAKILNNEECVSNMIYCLPKENVKEIEVPSENKMLHI